MLPVIALIGRPNVGKSTLFNVLTKTRDAIVADEPGLTRDRQYGMAERLGTRFIVVDTGGLSGEKQTLDDLMARQTLLALEEADEVLFLVDAQHGLTSGDEVIADLVRRSGKSCTVVVNKVDGINPNQAQSDFYALGMGETKLISSAHRKGVGMLMDQVLESYKKDDGEEEGTDVEAESGLPNEGPAIAVIGRPNVGKSTLINRLAGDERVVAFRSTGNNPGFDLGPFRTQWQTLHFDRHGRCP